MAQRDRPEGNGNGMLAGTDAPWSMTADYQREVFRFLSMRFTKDAEFLKGLERARTFEEVFGLESEWMKEAFRDYATEAANVFRTNTERVRHLREDAKARIAA